VSTDLDRLAVNEQSIKLARGGGGTIGSNERDICDATAQTVGSIDEFNSLDRAYCIDKVFLVRQRSRVSLFESVAPSGVGSFASIEVAAIGIIENQVRHKVIGSSEQAVSADSPPSHPLNPT